MKKVVEGIERVIFGDVTADEITRWLDQLVYRRLDLRVESVLFRAGRLAAVYGMRLTNGSSIVTKVYRIANLEHLAAVVACERLLVDAGYPCPVPLDGPVEVDGHVLLLEALLDLGERGNAHDALTRQAMARGLGEQIGILRSVPELQSHLQAPPGWAAYAGGPWPTPHDPIFDFSTTPVGFEWLDDIAASASEALLPQRPPDAIGHCDWVCQNLRFNQVGVSAAYDWDSLLAETESVLAGLAAGAFTEGSIGGAQAPTPQEVGAFLSEYEATRPRTFSKSERAAASAAATWVLAYNARCDLSAATLGKPPAEGSPLQMLSHYRDSYLTLRW